MKFTKSQEVAGVVFIEPDVFEDERGFFFESYNRELFRKNGIDVEFVQDNRSRSCKGVLRGLHYQLSPKAQAKLLSVTRGRAFDVAVDIRRDSKTFGRFVSSVLSAENHKMVYIPEGFAHGFCALDDDTEFLYKVSAPYSRELERGVLWNDPAIGIPWPVLDGERVISEKDRKHPFLKNI